MNPGPAQLPENRKCSCKEGHDHGAQGREEGSVGTPVMALSCSHEALVHFFLLLPTTDPPWVLPSKCMQMTARPATALVRATVTSHPDCSSNLPMSLPAHTPTFLLP